MTREPRAAGGGSDVCVSAAGRHALLTLARATVTAAVGERPLPSWRRDDPELSAHGAAFVTLRERATGDLRGCRGETVAVRPLAESVMDEAVAAALDDPRFAPVREAELPGLHLEISVLSPMTAAAPADVDVARHGVMITHRGRRGLLLPQVAAEMGWDRDALLAGVCRKAGLPARAWREAGAELLTFEAQVWGEQEGGWGRLRRSSDR
jgi:AmmeMemoRadiSam system protein A